MLHLNENKHRQPCRQLTFSVMIAGKPISAICTGCNRSFSGFPGQPEDEAVLQIRSEFINHVCKAPPLPDEVPEWVN